jgi:hypothetical protein
LKGFKQPQLISKIATVWYIQSNHSISSYIVDDIELRRILENKLIEIIAVQVYIGGWPVKGNGLFEHRMWIESNGFVRHQTYEYIDTSEQLAPTTFSTNKLKIFIVANEME